MRKNPLSNMSAHGGIITSEFLEIIRSDKVNNPRVEPQCFTTFNAPNPPQDKRELDRQIDASFKQLLERWDAISNRYQKMTVSEARTKWMVPFFKELGFDSGFNKEDIIVDGDDKLRFRLSHRGWISASAPMVHMVAPSQDLEEAGDGSEGEMVRRGHVRSPHNEMQAYLNVTKGLKWGIVTNGILLRILREYFHTTTKGYVEFDLENIFRERSFTDFRALYRMAHASRFLPDQDGVSPLEQFYKESVAAGVKVGEDLRQNVKKAIEALGNGFLTPELTKKLIEDDEFCKAYYAELLRVIYRLLFLLFAEQRAMLPTKESLYIEEYSITRLRQMAEERHGKDDHHDLWEGLKVTFQMLKKGCPPLKVFGYNGNLFDDSELPTLSVLACKNEDVLEAIRNLTSIEEEKVLKRINYLDLGVEEIGSIYESLLDYAPRVFGTVQEIFGESIPANRFYLDPRGVVRKSSGSYYTNPRLIDELVNSALKPVVEEKIAKSSDKQGELLAVKVCDPSCGSGAFLIAANNYLGRELARLRSNQAEPSDREVKIAKRDVLQHCIYGVDLNPMAVELAKVSLWINSCAENMPLNFLDHHLKCGNSLIGTSPDLLKKGIPDDAFQPLYDNEKENSKIIRFRNSMQHNDRLITEFKPLEDQKQEAEEFASLDNLNEKTPLDIEIKKRKYLELIASEDIKKRKVIADTWAAAFFWPLNKDAPEPPTQGILRLIESKGLGSVDKKTAVSVQALSTKYRFFHWYLEFPDIFEGDSKGFDCLIGNPPWDTIEAYPDEFFSFYESEFSLLNSKEKQNRIAELLRSPNIKKNWEDYERNFKLLIRYFKYSSSFTNQGTGHLNAFKLFMERFYQVLSEDKRLGILVPSSFYTDEGCTDLRKLFFNFTRIEELFCFENKQKIFPIHSSFKFIILVAQKGGVTESFATGFMLHDLSVLPKLRAEGLHVTLDLVRKFSPATLSVMEFCNQDEVNLLSKIYSNLPLLGDNLPNTWNAEFHRDLHHAEDHELLRTDATGIPIYEGKMIHQYNHTYDEPTFWLSEKDANNFYGRRTYQEWKCYRLAYRGVASSTNETTLITTIIPKSSGTLMSLRVLQLFELNEPNHTLFRRISDSEQLFLSALMNSFVVNYITRRKISANLSTFYIYQLPIPRLQQNNWIFDQIVARAARLICTDASFADFWEAVYHPQWTNFLSDPRNFSKLRDWNELAPLWKAKCGVYGLDKSKHDIGDRAQLRNEIEALVAHLYEINQQEFKYILSTFPIVKEKAPWLLEGAINQFNGLPQSLKA